MTTHTDGRRKEEGEEGKKENKKVEEEAGTHASFVRAAEYNRG